MGYRLSQLTTSALLVSLASGALLLTPWLSESRMRDLCIEKRQLVSRLQVVMNCDSYAFLRLAERPARVLEKQDSARLSRPAYPVVGWVASVPFRSANALVKRFAASRFGGRRWYESPLNPYYLGYLLINWVALVAATYLFLRITKLSSAFSAAAIIPLTLLLVNGVTKAFFWTPHLQMFNVLIPMLAVNLTLQRSAGPRWTVGALMLAGLLCGLSSLGYGAFIVLFAAISASILLLPGLLRGNYWWLKLMIGWVAFFLPLSIWRAYVIGETGGFYMHETVAYGQFVWISNAFREGGVTRLVAEWIANSRLFFGTLWLTAAFPALLLAVALGIVSRAGKRSGLRFREVALPITSYYVVAIPFFALMGYYGLRLTWALAPPLLILIGLVLTPLLATGDKPLPRFVPYALSAGYAAYTIWFDHTAYITQYH